MRIKTSFQNLLTFTPKLAYFVNFVHGFGGFFLGFYIFVFRFLELCPQAGR